MTLPKIIIGGIATVVIIVGAYYVLEKQPNKNTSGQSLLEDYQELLDEISDSKTKNNLSSACGQPQKFAEQIQALENKLDTLNKRKAALISQGSKGIETDNEEWIPPIPGSEVPDLDPMPSSDVDPEQSEGEWIPPIPGSEVPDLEPMPSSDVDPEQSEGEWIPPIPGSEVPDLDPMPSSDVDPEQSEGEWIPPIPGSEVPDLEPMPGSDVDPEQSEGEWIPPIPGSEVPDLEPMPGSDVDPEQSEGEWIPPIPGSEVPDLEPLPGDPAAIPELEAINTLEEKIILELNNLKTLCDEEIEKEIISTSCRDACIKYSDCAGYTEGATKEDQKDAYDSCMIECAKWSDETKICINKKPIKTVTDCTNLSLCALKEYSNVLDE